MTHERMKRLGAQPLGAKTQDVVKAIEALENLIPVSRGYRTVLETFEGAIIFANGAKFRTDAPSPLNRKDGSQNLEVLYGPGNGKHSIRYHAERCADELPPRLIPIGETPGGNLVCVDGAGVVYLWDHESMRSEGLWRVASSVDDFLDRLEPDDSGIGNTDGIVESESHLDF